MSSLNRSNCFQDEGNNYLAGNISGLEEDTIEKIFDYRAKILAHTQCRSMPAEYGADYNDLVQWMLTYNQNKRPQTSEVLEMVKKLL